VTQYLLQDDFSDNAPLNPDVWDINQYAPVNNPSYYGRTQIEQYLPAVSNGALQLTLQTYNPTGPGNSFLGSEIISNQTFYDNNCGIAFMAVAKIVNPVPGMVGGIFAYNYNSSTDLDNELDFESLTNDAAAQNNQEQTNVYSNQPLGAGNPEFVPDPSLTTYQTYTMEWFPNEVLWFIDGQLVRESTVDVPQGPMAFHLNFWAPDTTWADAYSASLLPTANPNDNTTYTFDVASVSVAAIENNTVPLVLSGGGNSVNNTQEGAAVAIDAGLGVSDASGSTLVGATVAIGAGFLAGDTLNFTNQNGIAGSYNATTGVLTLTGSAILATYQAALESITFSSTIGNPSYSDTDLSRTVSWTVTDGTLPSNTITSTIIVGDPGDVVVSNIPGQAYSAYEELYDGGVYAGIDYFFTSVFSVLGQPYSSYEYDYSPGNDFIGSKFYYTGVTGEPYTGYEYDYDGGGSVTRVDFTGVTGAAYSSYEYDFVGGVFAGSKFTVTAAPTGATYSSYELDYNSSNVFTGDKFFFTDIIGQSYTGEEEDFDANGALIRVLITGVTGQSYSSLEEDFSAGTYQGYKAYYTGITGQSYTGEEVDVSATNQITKVVYTGMSSTPYSSVEEDFSGGALTDEIYDFTNVSGASAYAYQVEDNASGVAQQEIYDNNDGSHTIIGLGAADQTFTSIADDTFTGGGSGETFVFTPVYGSDTITDFYQYTSGSTHDTISLSTSEFADFAAVLSSAQNVGANTVITAPTGDTLTLDNMTTAALAANQGDFTFHA
jgi:hypothetical protein